MQAVMMLFWMRWRETRLMLGIIFALAILSSGIAAIQGASESSWVSCLLILPLLGGGLFLSRCDARGRTMGLPGYMHRLPVSTWKLVSVDLIFTVLATAAFMNIPVVAQLYVLLKMDMTPLFMSGVIRAMVAMPLLIVLILSIVQVVLWLIGPVSTPAALVAIFPSITLVVAACLYVTNTSEGVPGWVNVCFTFIVFLSPVYPLGVWAVHSDRTGRLAGLRTWIESFSIANTIRHNRFVSSWKAHIWRESVREQRIMIVLLIGCLAVSLTLVIINADWVNRYVIGQHTAAAIRGGIAAAWWAGLLLALRRRPERDPRGFAHLLTLPVSTRFLTDARLRADAGVLAVGCTLFLLTWALSGGLADRIHDVSYWKVAGQLVGGMLLMATLYVAALPILTALILVFLVTLIFMGIAECDLGITESHGWILLSAGLYAMAAPMALLTVYACVKGLLPLRRLPMVIGLVVLTALTAPLALAALIGETGPPAFGAAAGGLILWPFAVSPLVMARARHR